MEIHFLGGTDEVGASCLLVEIAGHRILVDCGIRMKARDGDKLPYLDMIRERGGLDGMVLTHAHIDHSGALPVVVPFYPKAPLYLTPPTLSLIQILLVDSLKIMEGELEREGEVPLYPSSAVEQVMGSVRPLNFFHREALFDGDVHLTFYPAGHILGAGMVVLEGKKDGVLAITGDISVTDQITVAGASLPPVKPDLMVIESTYGGRLHANRAGEEQRLLEQTSRILQKDGAILFPTFAIGRAQEVILILSRAMEQGKIPRVPFFVDGMVRKVCGVYQSYPAYVTPWLRKRAKKHGHPFFYENGPATSVEKARSRADYAKMRPAIFVASSGMLTGGPSQFYARELVQDPASFISITGYQDEESPGRHLQNLASKGKGELKLGHEKLALQCGIGTYSLSAHGDTSELAGILGALSPKKVALVHGDGPARQAFAQYLSQMGLSEVVTPSLGQSLKVDRGRRERPSPSKKPRVKGSSSPPLQEENLLDLARDLLAQNRPGRLYTVQEILMAWGDFQGARNTGEIQRIIELFQSKDSPFQADHRRPFLWKVRQGKEGELETGWPLNQAEALQKAGEIFPEEAWLYKQSALLDKKEILLSFHFPKVAQQAYQKIIHQLESETGWKISVRSDPHGGAMEELARSSIPAQWPLRKNPSLHLGDEKMVISVDLPEGELDRQKIESENFKKITGFELVVLSNTQKANIPVAKKEGACEINRAYRTIRQAFTDQPHGPLKVGLKAGAVEVRFISPEVGELYNHLLRDLEMQTGWTIQIGRHPDQHRIKQLAKSLLSPLSVIKKEPTFLESQKEVVFYTASPPPKEELQNIQQKFKNQTGYALRMEE